MDTLKGMKWDDESKHRVFEPLKQIKFENGELLFYSLKKNDKEKETLKISGIDDEKDEGFYVILKYSEKVNCYKNVNSQRENLGEETFSDNIIKQFSDLEKACKYFNNLRDMLMK